MVLIPTDSPFPYEGRGFRCDLCRVSAIGDALRAGEITKPQWTTLKKMIKADRNEANEDFRESYYESQSWSLWVKNMMLELDIHLTIHH